MRILTLATLALLLCITGRVATAQTVEETLRQVRSASGLARLNALSAPLAIRGTERGYYGEDFEWECVFDGARFRVSRSGRLSESHAFDGVTGWTRELGGETRVCELGDLTLQVALVGILSGRLLAEGSPLRFKVDGEHTREGQVSLSAGMDDDRARVRVEIDRATWRARRWHVEVGVRRGTIELEGEVEFAGIKFPRKVRDGANELTIAKVEAVGKDDTRFRMTPGTPADFTYDPKASPDVTAKTAPTMCLLVKPLINGKEVGWFLLDTGSQLCIINPEKARVAGIETFGNATLTGVATRNVPGRFGCAETLTLGPLTIRSPLLMVSSLGSSALPEGVVGVLGMPVFARCVVEIEADRQRVSLFDSQAYRLPVGEWMPLHTNRYLPLIPGRYEGRPAVFRLDTGVGGIIMDEPTTRAWKLNERGPITITGSDFIDGPRPLMQLTAESMGLGRLVGQKVPVRAATNPDGKYTDTYSHGMVGMGFGRAFVLVFDYPGRRIAAEHPETWPNRKH